VKGDSIPWVVQVEGKCFGGMELVESLIVERGTLSSLRDLCLLWIHSPSSGVSCCWELEQQGYGWEEHSSSENELQIYIR
jgi:hypothetical protein